MTPRYSEQDMRAYGEKSADAAVKWHEMQAELCQSAGVYGEAAAHIRHAQALYVMPLPPLPQGEADGCRPIDSAPRDGTMLRLLVQFDEHSFEDSLEPCWTIGFNNLANTQEDRWQFAAWDWCHDCIVEAQGKPLGWLPMHDLPPAGATPDAP